MPDKEQIQSPIEIPKKILSNTHKRSNSERVWRAFTFIILPISLTLLNEAINFQNYVSKNYRDHANFQDIWIAAISTFIIFFIRKGFIFTLFNPVYQIVDPKHKGEERNERTKRVVKWIYDIFYYGASTWFFYKYFGHSYFMPPTLFGQGQCAEMFRGYPNIPDLPLLREYYLVQMGSHFCSVIEQILYKWKDAKFYEYFLHHYLAFILIFYSFLIHLWPLGVLVLITHDFSDIFLASARAIEGQIYLKSSKIFIYIYLGCTTFAWAYFRLVVFPSCQMWHSFMAIGNLPQVWDIVSNVYTFQFSLLVVLFIMNVYWVFILAKMLVRTIKIKQLDNYYDPKLLGKTKEQ